MKEKNEMNSGLRARFHGGGVPQVGEVTSSYERLYGQAGYHIQAGYLSYLGSPTSLSTGP